MRPCCIDLNTYGAKAVEGQDDLEKVYITVLSSPHEKTSIAKFRRSSAKIGLMADKLT